MLPLLKDWMDAFPQLGDGRISSMLALGPFCNGHELVNL